MKPLIILLAAASICVGCASTSTSKVFTSEIVMRHGTNEIRILQPKDTSFKDFMIGTDGTIRIKDYRSTANEAAISSAERQADFQNNLLMYLMQQGVQTGGQVGSAVARANGIPIPPPAAQAPIPFVQLPAHVHPDDAIGTNAVPAKGQQ